MNYDMEKIMSLNNNEILIVNGLQEVVEKAKEDAELIAKVYRFGIGEDRIEVWHDQDRLNFEYLTHAGVWQARYLHQSYDVNVDADTIFDYYRAEWLIDHKFDEEYEEYNGQLTLNGQKKLVLGYFKAFVERTKKQE